LRKGVDFLCVEHIAAREQLRIGNCVFRAALRKCQAFGVASADSDRCTRAQKQFGGRRPMPDEPPVTTATWPVKSIWIIFSPNAFMYLLPAAGPFLGR
jgi:hypothetical protein